MTKQFRCTREDMEQLDISDLGYTCDAPGCNRPAIYNCFGMDICQQCYETLQPEPEPEFTPPTDDDWLLVGKVPD